MESMRRVSAVWALEVPNLTSDGRGWRNQISFQRKGLSPAGGGGSTGQVGWPEKGDCSGLVTKAARMARARPTLPSCLMLS